MESKHYIELTISEGHKVNPQIVHFTFVALCGGMRSFCHPHKESIKDLFVFMEGGALKKYTNPISLLVSAALVLLFSVFTVMRW